MSALKTPEQIAQEIQVDFYEYGAPEDGIRSGYLETGTVARMIVAAIEADRAQRRQVYIAQNDGGDVANVFYDADEATTAHQDGYSVIEETVWELGEYADVRIQELTEEWEAATGDTARNYVLSEDDWRFGLTDDEAAEIVRLIEFTKPAPSSGEALAEADRLAEQVYERHIATRDYEPGEGWDE